MNKVWQNFGDYFNAKPTQKAVDNSVYKSQNFAADKNWYYELRSPLATSDAMYVRNVWPGAVNWGPAYSSIIGVRPAFYLNMTLSIFKSGNGSLGTPYVTSVASTKPVITINGQNPVTTDINTAYTDAGATAVDSGGGVVAVTVVSTVRTEAAGTYTVTYTAVDKDENKSTAVRTVYVMSGSSDTDNDGL